MTEVKLSGPMGLWLYALRVSYVDSLQYISANAISSPANLSFI